MTIDKQKLRELANNATPRITQALGHSPPTPAEQFYAAALVAVPALLDALDSLRADHASLLAERDAMQSIATQATRERDRLHATLKAVADVCIDKGKLRVGECVAEDAPPKAVAKIIEQRDEALGVGRATYTSCPQCGFAEVDLATIDSVQGDAEAKTAEAIAVWLDEVIEASKRNDSLHVGELEGVCAEIRAGEWRKS